MTTAPHPRAGAPRACPALAGWHISQHALRRALQRRVLPEEILAAIDRPQVTRPAHRAQYRERDGVAVVVNVQAHRIVTVLVTHPALADAA
jgi:hypothetical protein